MAKLTPEQRQRQLKEARRWQASRTPEEMGKIAVLALGYQGGKNAFRKMARAYGLKLSDDDRPPQDAQGAAGAAPEGRHAAGEADRRPPGPRRRG